MQKTTITFFAFAIALTIISSVWLSIRCGDIDNREKINKKQATDKNTISVSISVGGSVYELGDSVDEVFLVSFFPGEASMKLNSNYFVSLNSMNSDSISELKKLRQLKNEIHAISLSDCQGVQNDVVREISSYPNLKYIKLHGFDNVSQELFHKLFSSGRIEEFLISNSQTISTRNIVDLLALNNVRKLTISHCPNLKEFSFIGSRSKKFELIDLTGSSDLRGFIGLEDISSVDFLVLSRTLVDDKELSSLASKITVCNLDISFCSLLTGKSLSDFVDMPDFRSLRVDFSGIKKEYLEEFVRLKPKCKIIN